MTRHTLSTSEARRAALAAQGFAAPPRTLPSLFGKIGVLQIDSVNVLARAHYLTAFARLGAYDRAALDRAAWGRRPALFEYWGHMASLQPVETQPLFRWRMEAARTRRPLTSKTIKFIDEVRRDVEVRGALTASELGRGEKGAGGWWGWSEAKHALEWLFYVGEVAVVTRRNSFERVYDLAERALPPAIYSAPTPGAGEAHRALIEIAARALGVATMSDLADYFRLKISQARPAIAALVEAGVLRPVTVEDWNAPAYLHRDAKIPRRVEACALLCPFDNLIFFRQRAQRLLGARIRIEIYTPSHKRTHGYYVLPFLLGERIVARVDLKADRQMGALAVRAAHLEPGANARAAASALALSLREMADWLGLPQVAIGERGDLAAALRRAAARENRPRVRPSRRA